MKSKPNILYILSAGVGLYGRVLFGHDVPVHRAITVNALESAYDNSFSYKAFVTTISSDCDQETAINSAVEGSAREDDPTEGHPMDLGGHRSLNHFYDPLTGNGLTDFPIFGPPPYGPLGTNSFIWASRRNGAGTYGAVNVWSWQNARDSEWTGMTAENSADRHDALTNMFRAIGQVMHLLEDTSQPQHVRNEQHLDQFWKGVDTPWRSPIEDYGKINVAVLNYQHDILDWRGAGFTRLEDFWNAHRYNGNATALDADTSGGVNTLGLAEWCNANFLGARHTFPEYFTPGSVEFYPFPSRDHSTDYSDVKSNPSAHVDNYQMEDGTTAKGIYLAKTGDGIHFSHLSRVNYLGAKVPGLTGTPYCTIKDPNVLKDYHDQFIPKAVKYSAGLLDYYFRGNLGLGMEPFDWDASVYNLQVINISGETLKDGAFYVYEDDPSGIRTLVATQSLTGTLEHFSQMTISIPGPVSAETKCIVVYKGTIGVTEDVASDPVDHGIAIAARSFTLVPQTDPNFPCPDCSCNQCVTLIAPTSNSNSVAQVESIHQPRN